MQQSDYPRLDAVKALRGWELRDLRRSYKVPGPDVLVWQQDSLIRVDLI